jgi:hypothetical protein
MPVCYLPRHRAMAPLELLVSLAAAGCVTDDACSLNGLCKAGACQCHAPWSGSSCGILDELPGPRAAAYGRNSAGGNGSSSAVPATWGASVLRWSDGLHHMLVSEMTEGCGLSTWGTNTQIAHAVSKDPLGPFTRSSYALGPESTNPAVIAEASGKKLWLFHIGAGKNDTKGERHCGPPRPGQSLGASAAADVTASTSTAGPAGPWTPQPLGAFPCNNPAPALASNGSALLLCNDSPRHWSVHSSASGIAGPWQQVSTIATVVPGTRRKDANWEGERARACTR